MTNLALIAIFGIDMLLSARLAYFEGAAGRAVLLAEARFQPNNQTGSVVDFCVHVHCMWTGCCLPALMAFLEVQCHLDGSRSLPVAQAAFKRGGTRP